MSGSSGSSGKPELQIFKFLIKKLQIFNCPGPGQAELGGVVPVVPMVPGFKYIYIYIGETGGGESGFDVSSV